MSRTINRLTIDQRDRKLKGLQKAAEELLNQAPPTGWVKALRTTLSMSDRAFARRLGVTHGSVQDLERNEKSGKVTLESLRRAASALDADLVYAIVPRKPLKKMISERARALAKERVAPIAHSMAMEDQRLASRQFDRQVDDLARELEDRPRKLWR